MTSLPTWAVYAVSLGSPAATLLTVVIAQVMARKGARELERRSRREETMRNLRWAAELAVEQDPRRAELGVSQLSTLLASDLLDPTEMVFVEAGLDAVYNGPASRLHEHLAPSQGVLSDPTSVEAAYPESTPDEEG